MPDASAPDRGRPAVLQLLPRLERDELGRSTVDMARYLRQKGWRAIVASAGGPLERDLAVAGGTHLRLPLDRAGWLAIWRNARRIARAVRRHRIDIVHARAPGPAWSGAFATRRTDASFMTTFHDVYPIKGVLGRRYYGIMAAGERVIAVSDFIAEELANRFKVDPARIRVVRRWIDPEEFDPVRVRGHRVVALAERWGISPGPKVVMMPGSVIRGRGHLLLLAALTRIERSDFVVLFVGDLDPHSAYVKEILATLRRTGLGERVRFGGEAEDLPAALTLADVVVLPTTRPDPSGFMAVAAQAMGKPVIVTNHGALSESVLPAATGWLLPPDDVDELARALELALSLSEDVVQRLAARARAFVVSEFGMGPMCARTLDVYRELARPAPRRREAYGNSLVEAG
ncbi:glycosyltransferase family 4 protein [Benzoatithermus flavus]|uniref:Glycosyltransferase family 4 protein n=1 Tax=Benzoatithermus flavus TaxID=3108223 RepID=A0ABU8XQB3_9PROT